MASIVKRGDVYRAQVRRRGVNQSGTFRTRAEAQRWAADLERDIEDRRVGRPVRKTWRDAVGRYRLEVSAHKVSARNEGHRLNRLLKTDFVDRSLAEISSDDWASWRASRRVAPASVNRDFHVVRHIYRHVCSDWGWLPVNPMARLKPLPEPPHRRFVWAEHAQRAMLAALGGPDPGSVKGRVAMAVEFALETGMRAGEICALRRHGVAGAVARLERSKNGHPREVPLSPAAQRILARLGDDLFDLTPSRLDAVFRKYRPKALKHLRFHDLRHTAATRLGSSGRLTAPELAAMFGWRDLGMVMTYFNPSADDLAAKLAA
jgi:integrase